MESAILTTNSKKDLRLLLVLAKKMGVKGKILSSEQLEDLGLKNAIKKGRTGKFADTEKFLQKLNKWLRSNLRKCIYDEIVIAV